MDEYEVLYDLNNLTIYLRRLASGGFFVMYQQLTVVRLSVGWCVSAVISALSTAGNLAAEQEKEADF